MKLLRLCLVIAAIGAVACHSSSSSDPPPDGGTQTPPAPTPGKSSWDAIAEAETAGKIDHDTALMYEVFALYDRSRLPPEYVGDDSASSLEGTGLMLEVQARLSAMTPDIRNALVPFFKRPDDPASFWAKKLASVATSASALHTKGGGNFDLKVDDPSGHVRVFYPESKYAELAKRAADDAAKAWPLERHAMDSLEPCSDGTLTGNDGGSSRLDLYIVPGFIDVPRTHKAPSDRTVPGVTLPLTWDDGVERVPEGCHGVADILLVDPTKTGMDKDFDGTVVHEIFHAFQDVVPGGVAFDNYWFAEATAAWAEDLVFPTNDTEQEALDEQPTWPTWQTGKPGPLTLWKQGSHEQYATYLWPFFLINGKGNDSSIIGRFFEQAEKQTVIQAMHAHPSYADWFAEFLAWNINSGSLQKYVDHGEPLPLDPLHNPPRLPQKDVTPTSGPVEVPLTIGPAEGRYVRLYPSGAPKVTINLAPLNKPSLRVHAWLHYESLPDALVDWTGLSEKTFCTDKPDENPSWITLIVANVGIDAADSVTGTITAKASTDACVAAEAQFTYGGTLDATVNDPGTGMTGTYSYGEKIVSKLTLKFRSKDEASGDIVYDVEGEHTITVTGHGTEWSTKPEYTGSATDDITGSGTVHTPTRPGEIWPFPGTDPSVLGTLVLHKSPSTYDLQFMMPGVPFNRTAKRHDEFKCPVGTNKRDEVWNDTTHGSDVTEYDCTSGMSTTTKAMPTDPPVACWSPLGDDALSGDVPATGPITVKKSQIVDCGPAGPDPIGCWSSYWYSPLAITYGTCKLSYGSELTFDPPVRW